MAGVLSVHVYAVTHRKAEGAARVMARIDLKQDINCEDAAAITTWLYKQKGIDHVLCNADTDIAIFTFSPTEANADEIVAQLNKATGYKGRRYMPEQKDMMSGCPVSASSFSDKFFGFYKRYSLFPLIDRKTAS